MTAPNPASYEHALSLLCDLHRPVPCPAVAPVTAFIADLFSVSREDVQAAVARLLADHAHDALAAMAQREGQPEADLYGDNAVDVDFG
jgi:hypothetical protein